MGLRDEVIAHSPRQGPKCKLADLCAEHPLGDEIKAIISDHSLSMRAAAVVFYNNGIDVQEWSIKRHRSNLCSTCRDRGVTF